MIPQCVVSDRYKFISILIAKNATSTMRGEFRKTHYQSYECRFDQIETDKLDTYFTFALLRNPVTRLLSAYQEISMRKDGHASFAHDPSFFLMPDNWERFMTFLAEVKRQKWDPHLIDQHDYIRDKRMDFLGTVETFDRSMTYLYDRLGISDYTPLPKRRSREGRKSIYQYSRFYIDHIDDMTTSIIQNLYPRDLDLVAQVDHAMNANPDIGGTIADDVIKGYQKHNTRHPRYLVLHLGDRGFLAEFTLVARAMIYGVAKGLQLVLDTTDFAYTVQHGWTDYFEPFCETYTPDMESMVVRHVKFHKYGVEKEEKELESFDEVKDFKPDRLHIGHLEINHFQDMMKLCLMAIFRLNRKTQHEVNRIRTALQLPDDYVAVHIRRGDKVGNEDVYYPCDLYMEKLQPLESHTAIFVMSDDHRAVQEVKDYLSHHKLPNNVYSLCTGNHLGFDIMKVRKKAYFFGKETRIVEDVHAYKTYVYDETIRLLAEISIASESQQFISTYRSNVGRTVHYLHPHPQRCILMCLPLN